MFVLPLIEVAAGESQHILSSDDTGEGRPLIDPVEVMQRFARLGAQGFQVVDVDRATGHRKDNDEVLVRLCDATRLPIQAGGGVESLVRIQELLDTGVRRVLVGSMGVLHPDWLAEAIRIFEKQIIISIDVAPEGLLVKGRKEPAPIQLENLFQALKDVRVHTAHVAYLGTEARGPDLVRQVKERLQCDVTYQGRVAGEPELAELAQAGAAGVVMGQEAYDHPERFRELAKRFRVL